MIHFIICYIVLPNIKMFDYIPIYNKLPHRIFVMESFAIFRAMIDWLRCSNMVVFVPAKWLSKKTFIRFIFVKIVWEKKSNYHVTYLRIR